MHRSLPIRPPRLSNDLTIIAVNPSVLSRGHKAFAFKRQRFRGRSHLLTQLRDASHQCFEVAQTWYMHSQRE